MAPQEEAIAARQDVDGQLRKIGRLQLEIDSLEVELDRALNTIRSAYGPRIASRLERRRELTEGLETLCRDKRDELLPAAQKSVGLSFGSVGFRTGKDTIEFRVKLEEVVKRLKEMRQGKLVRVREDPDKQAIKRALATGQPSSERLAKAGIRLVKGAETWWCQINREAVAESLTQEKANR